MIKLFFITFIRGLGSAKFKIGLINEAKDMVAKVKTELLIDTDKIEIIMGEQKV